ncbi:hypothetical protein [Anaerotruncus rubiinfantis]|uniref:hypothetical protein n=1 Tax=Anaerotruncus rubiinfantis TaxID=1720200 RepID=UPI0034A0F2CB
MRRTCFGGIVLLTVLLLFGCESRTAGGSSVQMSVPEAISQAAPEEAEAKDSEQEESGAQLNLWYAGNPYGSQCGWEPDGQAVQIVCGNTMYRVDLQNRKISSAQCGGPVEPQEEVFLWPGEKYILRTGTLSRIARPDGPDGAWKLTNAQLYSLDGKLEREFHELTPEQAQNVNDVYEDFYSLEVYWLGPDTFAMNTGALLALCDAETGKLTMVEDFRLLKRAGYSVGNSGSYGISECQAQDGTLYYRASTVEEVGSQDTSINTSALFMLTASGERRQVFEKNDFYRFEPFGDRMLLYRDWNSGSAQNPDDSEWGTQVWLADPETGEQTELVRHNELKVDYPTDGSHYDYTSWVTENEMLLPTFHRYDLESGKETTFTPGDYDDRRWDNYDGNFGLRTTSLTRDGRVRFLYTVEWVEQDADGGYWTGECWSYTDGDAQPVKLDVPWIDWQCIRAINPQGTHGLFETEVENNWWNYRVMPLDSIT